MATPDVVQPDADTTSQLRLAVRQADSGAYLVEPRVIRRVVRELYNFARLSSRVPHTEVQVVASADIRRLTHPDELGLESFDGLPDPALLISLPEEHEIVGKSIQDQLVIVWRRLFHGAIDRAVRASIQSDQLPRAKIQAHIDSIGQVEFDEAHVVLASEQRLIDTESRSEAFGEFVATWWELSRFAPDLVPIWFPSLALRAHDEVIPDIHIDPNLLYIATRLTGAPDPDTTPQVILDEAQLTGVRKDWLADGLVRPSERRYQRLQRRRQRAAERGNTVAAGLAAMYALESATTHQETEDARQTAEDDIRTLVQRLQQALTFNDRDFDAWHESLRDLFHNSIHGFWNADKKLLHDLQKVCIDHERVTYRVDLVKWIVSRGGRPLRRPLTKIREVMMAKHLASSTARLVYVRLSGKEREQLAGLLHEATDLAEDQMRHRMRPTLRQTLLDVGFRPGNIPEKVAFDKLIEEALDCITYRGYLTMGYLRDAISRNDLKLADLTNLRELFRGDHLLRTDDELDIALDGVYRRGEFYLRGLQRVSSLAFGTGGGRFITLFVVIPFGGALVMVEGVTALLLGHGDETEESAETPGIPSNDAETEPADDSKPETNSEVDRVASTTDGSSADNSAESPEVDIAEVREAASLLNKTTDDSDLKEITHDSSRIYGKHPLDLPTRSSLILGIGLVLMALIHLPVFRQTVVTLLSSLWRLTQLVLWQLPKRIIQFPLLQWILCSRFVAALRRHVVNPTMAAGVLGYVWPMAIGSSPWNVWWTGTVAVLLSIVLNSRLGRDTEELVAEWVGNTWQNLRSRVVMAAFDWIMDFFQWALAGVERLIYAVDEWLRFHSDESWVSIIVKAVVGVVWSFIVFLIRIYVNLLIEPQVNPIKHFPVVTVAHKIMLPFSFFVTAKGGHFLGKFIGNDAAVFVVGTTWFLLPGVFGFLVWELKENWRLYGANRVRKLQPIVIGSHGESIPRLLSPGFHSGTLPKAFARLRRLERQAPSFRRFSQRRAWQDVLQHAERDLRQFVERDFIRLLEYCPVWQDSDLQLEEVKIACNSILISLDSDTIDGPPVKLLFQEQSFWIVVTVADRGLLRNVTSEQLHSFDTALLGFYRKAGVEIVREQVERNLVGNYPYDVCAAGLVIWPEVQFEREVTVDLHRPHQVRPLPSPLAITFGISPASAENVLFSKSDTNWYEWGRLWHVAADDTDGERFPLACVQSARLSLLRHE